MTNIFVGNLTHFMFLDNIVSFLIYFPAKKINYCCLFISLTDNTNSSDWSALNNALCLGDICNDVNGTLWKCKNVLDCPKAQADLKSQKSPQLCNFSGSNVVVCCETPPKPPIIGAKSKESEYPNLGSSTLRQALSSGKPLCFEPVFLFPYYTLQYL